MNTMLTNLPQYNLLLANSTTLSKKKSSIVCLQAIKYLHLLE